MRLAGVVAAVVIFGSGTGIRPNHPKNPDEVWLHSAFAEPRITGTKALRSGEYRKAIDSFRTGARAAQRAGDNVSIGRFLANQGSAHMMLGENRQAIHCLVIARDAAVKAKDLLTLQAIEASLANVYVLTGDWEAAGAAAGRGATIYPASGNGERQARTLMSFGRAMAKARGVDAAVPIWGEALSMAEATKSLSLEADVLELWGYELSEQDCRRAREAEEILARAWYKRKLAKDGRLPLTEGKLARHFRKYGEIHKARYWMDRTRQALEAGQKIPVPEWILRAEDAEIAREEGRLQASLDGYRRAQRLAETWRAKLPPMERSRLGAERRMAQEFSEGYLRTAARLYRQRPEPALAAEMFHLIQTTRAWSVGASGVRTADPGSLYAEARRLEARSLAGEESARTALQVLRTSIMEREAAVNHADHATDNAKLPAPANGEAVLTFWLNSEGSWLWVWTRQGLTLTALAPRETILAAVDEFRGAIGKNAPIRESGLRLRKLLLGELENRCLQATRWDIVADEGLFQVPFGALPGRTRTFLAEDVELRLVPNALRHGTKSLAGRKFLAVADPIFNTADERRSGSWFWQRVTHAGNGLPRLPGTRREAEAARAVWTKAGYDTAVHTGTESAEEPVLARLTQWLPSVIHFATHTLEAGGRPRLALTLRADGSQGLLMAEDIAALPVRAELVVMSACHSSGTETAKGSGILGLTRAWLTGGARQVVSTLWPVGDESTAFFKVFYEELARGKSGELAAMPALRQAQIACIRSGGTAAQPRNWAGHVLLARR